MPKSTNRYEALPTKGTISQSREEEFELRSLPPENVGSRSNSATAAESRARWSPALKLSIVLGLGVFILITVVGYLTFLWFGHRTGHSWSYIVLNNWATTTVAISALAIRTVVTGQMTLVTSILALTALKRGSIISQIPRMSSMRYSNSGPLELLYLLVTTAKSYFTLGLFLTTLTLGILTVLLQFTSTLLVSDLDLNFVETNPNQTYGSILMPMLNNSINTFWTDSLTSNSLEYPAFAEYSNRSDVSQQSKSDLYDDTGPVIRALLPVSAQNGRAKLRTFKGNASIYDARWMCTKPKFNLTTLQLNGNDIAQTLSGTLTIENTRPPMIPVSEELNFLCRIEQTRKEYEQWHLTTCVVGEQIGLLSGIQPGYNVSERYVIDEHSHLVPEFGQNTTPNWTYPPLLGDTWLVINLTDYNFPGANLTFGNGTKLDIGAEYDQYYVTRDQTSGFEYYPSPMNITMKCIDSWIVNEHNFWTSIGSTQTNVNISLSAKVPKQYTGLIWPFSIDVSVCSSAYNTMMNVFVDAEGLNVSEPTSVVDGSAQIGATADDLDTSTRGIMHLGASFQKRLDEDHTQVLHANQTEYASYLPHFHKLLKWSDSFYDGSWVSRAWYPFASHDHDDQFRVQPVHETRVELLQRIIKETKSPALAMQALDHTYITERYYKYLIYSNTTSARTVTFAELAIQPVRRRGYFVVVAALTLHVLATILTVFAANGWKDWWTTVNAIDQSWQAYAQVLTLQNEVPGVFDELVSTTRTDEQVDKDLEREGLSKQVFVLAKDENSQMKFRRRVAQA